MRKMRHLLLVTAALSGGEVFAGVSVRALLGFSQRDGVDSRSWSKIAYGFGLETGVAPKIVVGLNYLAQPKGYVSDAVQTFMKSDRLYLSADYWLKDYLSAGLTAGIAFENWGDVTVENSRNVKTLGARVKFEIPVTDNSALGSETDFVWYINSNFRGVAFNNSAYLRLNF